MRPSTKNWRIRIEERFIRLSDLIFENRLKVLFALLLFIVTMAVNLPKITFDTSTEGFLYKDDPQILNYDAFREQFGRDEKIIIAFKTHDVFDPRSLELLKTVHTQIENEVPYVKEVGSLINATKVIGKDDVLIIEDLFKEGIPSQEEKLRWIKEYVVNNPMYKNLYISEDATFTTLTITTQTYSSLDKGTVTKEASIEDDLEGFDTPSVNVEKKPLVFITAKETSQTIKAINTILKRHKSTDISMFIAGSPIVTENLQKSLVADMSVFIVYVILLIVLLLYLMFQRIAGVLLPISLVVLTLVTTVAAMAASGTPISSMTQILPSLLLAVGVGASVHLLAIFYKKFDETNDKKASIAYAMGHSGLAITMTSVTTAASLSSFIFSSIAPVSALGIFSSLGVMFALLLTLVYVPAMLALLPIKHKARPVEHKTFLTKVMHAISYFSIKYAKAVVAVTAVMIIVSIYLSSQMHFSHNPLHWFAKENQVRINTETIDENLKGSVTLEVIVDTKKEKGVYDPILLRSLDKAIEEIYTYKGEHYFIGKVVSLVDIVKDTHKAYNGNDQAFYTIPDDQDIIAQELVNWAWEDLEDLVDEPKTKMRISIKAPWVDSIEYVALISKVEKSLQDAIGDKASISITGTIPILATTITHSIESSLLSYYIAFGVITLLMILIIGSVKLGLIAMIPNLTPILLGVSLMVVFDLPLDMFTILIGAIAIGMVVDDTIHFMHNFQRYNQIHHDVDKAIFLTLESTGRAIFMTSIVLSSGFFVFMFASMTNLFNFGLITAFTVLMAMVTNLVVSASLMKLLVKDSKKDQL